MSAQGARKRSLDQSFERQPVPNDGINMGSNKTCFAVYGLGSIEIYQLRYLDRLVNHGLETLPRARPVPVDVFKQASIEDVLSCHRRLVVSEQNVSPDGRPYHPYNVIVFTPQTEIVSTVILVTASRDRSHEPQRTDHFVALALGAALRLVKIDKELSTWKRTKYVAEKTLAFLTGGVDPMAPKVVLVYKLRHKISLGHVTRSLNGDLVGEDIVFQEPPPDVGENVDIEIDPKTWLKFVHYLGCQKDTTINADYAVAVDSMDLESEGLLVLNLAIGGDRRLGDYEANRVPRAFIKEYLSDLMTGAQEWDLIESEQGSPVSG